MPYLKAILVNANDKANRMLRAKSMECISLVGMAVGKEKFKDDAKQVTMDVSYSFKSLCEMVLDKSFFFFVKEIPYCVFPQLILSLYNKMKHI